MYYIPSPLCFQGHSVISFISLTHTLNWIYFSNTNPVSYTFLFQANEFLNSVKRPVSWINSRPNWIYCNMSTFSSFKCHRQFREMGPLRFNDLICWTMIPGVTVLDLWGVINLLFSWWKMQKYSSGDVYRIKTAHNLLQLQKKSQHEIKT